MFFVLLGSAECLAYEGFVWNISSEYSLNFDFQNYLMMKGIRKENPNHVKVLFILYPG